MSSVLKQTFQSFIKHKSQWLAAAIAYYTVLAIAPLIIVLVEIGGMVFGHHQALLNEIYGYLQSTAGNGAATAIRSILGSTFGQGRVGIISQIVGWAVFILAAIGLLSSIQQALNIVWDAQPTKQRFGALIRSRAVLFLIIASLALVLLVSVVINAALTAANASLATVSPLFPFLMKVADFAVSLIIIAVVFAIVFRFVPQRKIAWRDIRIGALVTSLLFVIGQFLLGWYLGRAGMGSSYGMFGSIVIFLIWTNYSAQMFLIGAEFTNAYASAQAASAQNTAMQKRAKDGSPQPRQVATASKP